MTKTCCVCGDDVTHAKRYKDSSGLYWCASCNAKDKKKKSSGGSVTCPSCTQSFPASKMVRISGRFLCQECASAKAAQTQTSSGGGGFFDRFSFGGGMPQDTKRLVILGGVMLVLAAVAYYINFG